VPGLAVVGARDLAQILVDATGRRALDMIVAVPNGWADGRNRRRPRPWEQLGTAQLFDAASARS
jgi:hypothetical protein